MSSKIHRGNEIKDEMRRRELLEFRTPQHPSLGTNNWGGASPLLARDIPKESLEQRYQRLNSVRTKDEIFPTNADDHNYYHVAQSHAEKHQCPPTPNRRRGLLWKFLFPKKEKLELGSKTNTKKKRWFPRLDPKNRWPQGWV